MTGKQAVQLVARCHRWEPTDRPREYRCATCAAWCRRGLDGSITYFDHHGHRDERWRHYQE